MAVTRIENYVRYLSFDDEYLEMGPTVDDPIAEVVQTKNDPRKVLQVASLAYGLLKQSEAFESLKNRGLNNLVLDVRRIRLEQIDSVQFSPNQGEINEQNKPFLQFGKLIPGVGQVVNKINPAAYDKAGKVLIQSAAASGSHPFELEIHQTDVEKAKEFVAELESRIKNRGQKVEIVGIGLPTFTPPGAPDEMKVCPDCAEEVKSAARKCRYCGYEFAPAS